MRNIFRGRRTIWCSWIVTLVVPPIVNTVSSVTGINHECYFVVQISTGVALCSTGYSWRSTL